MKILIVLSSTGQVPCSERKTGTGFEELAAPYYRFKDAKVKVTLASIEGGPAPIDPWSEGSDAQTDATRRFSADPNAMSALARTVKLSSIRAEDFDAIFYTGGLGPVFDLTSDCTSIALIEAMQRADKPVAAMCHGLAALRLAHIPDGTPFVTGRSVADFSGSEERASCGDGLLPFMIESELRRLGRLYTSAPDWQLHVDVDGQLITGQNPVSSLGAAQEVLKALA